MAEEETAQEEWKNRIVGIGEEAPDQLLANPMNWRIHPKFQQDALEEVLNKVGWVERVLINQTTGNLVDGHLRVQLALRREEKTIPVQYVELTAEEEKLILASKDSIAGLAAVDGEQLDALMEDVKETFELNVDALGEMFDDMARANGIGSPPPNETPDSSKNKYGDPNERDFWPEIRISVPKETVELYDELIEVGTGEIHERFTQLLETAQRLMGAESGPTGDE